MKENENIFRHFPQPSQFTTLDKAIYGDQIKPSSPATQSPATTLQALPREKTAFIPQISEKCSNFASLSPSPFQKVGEVDSKTLWVKTKHSLLFRV